MPSPLWGGGGSLLTARLDSTRIIVGEQARLTVTVRGDTAVHPVFPELSLPAPFEVVRTEGSGMSRRYVITSFDTVTALLPAIEVRVGNRTLTTQRLRLQVYEMKVDTTHAERYFPIKGIHEPEFAWDDWRWVLFASLLAALLMLASALCYTWLCSGLPVIRLLRRKPKLPPHEVAMRDIDQLRHSEEPDSKAYYTHLTDILRTYIRDRYAFNALEMTSTEILARLQEENDADAIDELRQLFSTADLAKFAKYNALMGESDAHLTTALDYVTRTKLDIDPNAKDELPRLPPDDRRHLIQRRVLIALIGLMLAGSLASLVYVVYRIMQLL